MYYKDCKLKLKHSKNVKKIVLEALKIKSNVHARYKKFTECIQRSKIFPYRWLKIFNFWKFHLFFHTVKICLVGWPYWKSVQSLIRLFPGTIWSSSTVCSAVCPYRFMLTTSTMTSENGKILFPDCYNLPQDLKKRLEIWFISSLYKEIKILDY